MSPLSALKLMVQHYPGGRDAMATLLGKSSETLRQELGGYPGFKMGVVDACVISEACIAVQSEHCHAYANAVASNCGGFIQLPVVEMREPANVQKTLGVAVKEFADVTVATLTADAGGYSDNARKALKREIAEAYAALQRLEQDIDAQHAAGKPAAEAFPALHKVTA